MSGPPILQTARANVLVVPEAEHRVRRLAVWLGERPVAVPMLLVFAILYTRGLTIFDNPQPIWDDKNFIADGILYGGPVSWFQPYAGYILVIPRMLSDGFTIFNLLEAPWWEGIFSLAAMAWAYSLVLSPGFDYLLPRRWRIVLVCAATLMPWYTETYAALCNIHWFLFIGLALLSLARYEDMSRLTRFVLPAATALLVFSTVNSVLAFPVFAARTAASIRDRSYTFWYSLLTCVLVLTYAWIGLAVTSHMPSSWPGRIVLSDRPDVFTFVHFMAKGVGFKVVEQSLFGIRVALFKLAFPAAYWLSFTAWVGLAAGAIALAMKRGQKGIGLALVAVAYYTVATIAFVGLFRSEYVVAHFIRDGQYYGADRYFVPPSLFFYLTVIWMLHRLDFIPVRRPLLTALAVGFCLAVAIDFEYPRFPDYHWRKSVLAYYESLLQTRGTSARPSEFRIVIHPPAYEWNLVLPLYELSPSDRRRVETLLAAHRGDRSAR